MYARLVTVGSFKDSRRGGRGVGHWIEANLRGAPGRLH